MGSGCPQRHFQLLSSPPGAAAYTSAKAAGELEKLRNEMGFTVIQNLERRLPLASEADETHASPPHPGKKPPVYVGTSSQPGMGRGRL